ncbi:MAG: 30S ribosomal protein S2 [Nitrosopumilus sp.]
MSSKYFDAKDDGGSTEKLITSQVSEQKLLSTGIRIGTLVKTKSMERFILRTRSDGLHVIDVAQTLSRIEVAGKFIASSDISRVVVYSSREYGKTPVERFCELTGSIPITGRFMPGTFTHTLFHHHLDPELVVVTDPSMDYQAVGEASRIGVPVITICDTDNVCTDVDLVIPANNRGRKSLAAVLWLLARVTLVESGALGADQQMSLSIEDFETKLIDEKIEG